MIPTRRKRALAALLLLVAAGGVLAATLLWRTTVPTGLELPDVDVSSSVSPAVLHRAEHFSAVERAVNLAAIVVLLGALVVYARVGVRFTRESAAGRIGTGMLLAMLGFAVVWLAELPFGLFELWWQRRYGVSDVDYVEWILESWWGLGGLFLFLSFAILVVMGLAKPLGERWWLAGAPVFVALAAVFTLFSPWLAGVPTRPLKDERLKAAERRLARAEHVKAVPLWLGDVEGPPNAFAAGIGPTRRIVIFEGFFEPPFRESEVEVVLAHELGHHAHRHLVKGIGLFALFAFPGAFLIARLTRRAGGMASPAAVPLSLLVYMTLVTAASPLENGFSRRWEAEADWSALQATRNPGAARALFREFVPTTLDDPSPPGWYRLLFETHPTTEQRIAMVEAWKRRYATSAAQSP